MFSDMLGDLQNAIYGIGLAVVVSLLFVAGNAMAMAMRERTSEVAILKAIGFSKGRVLFLVLTEAILVAGLGGAMGSLGCKALCDIVDVAKYSAGFSARVLRALEGRPFWFGGFGSRGLRQRRCSRGSGGQFVRDQRPEKSGVTALKHLPYIFRNARRNPVRSVLTIASTAICLFLMMILLAFFAINNEVAENSRIYNRIVTMNANGFAGMVPIAVRGRDRQDGRRGRGHSL